MEVSLHYTCQWVQFIEFSMKMLSKTCENWYIIVKDMIHMNQNGEIFKYMIYMIWSEYMHISVAQCKTAVTPVH